MRVSNYWKPTPKRWRKLGDALLGVSTMGVSAILMDYKWAGILLYIIGLVGKFLTNLFNDDNEGRSN